MACWKHAAVSYVEQPNVAPAPKDRGAEQDDVDGPLECSITLAQVASGTRTEVASMQRRGVLPWIGQGDGRAASEDFDQRAARARAFEAEAVTDEEVRIDPRHEIQVGGGLPDFWYLDDGDIICSPVLVQPTLQA